MKVIADLHLHSKYSRAVSPKMIVGEIAEWAKRKGIGLVGTGDWTHPLWLRELKTDLREDGSGLLRRKIRNSKFEIPNKSQAQNPKLQNKEPLFLLSTEIASIYSQGGKLRRIHNLVLAPSFSVVEKINNELLRRKCNLMSDGRPIIGLSAEELVELVLGIDKCCMIIPAHCWTPWFSLYGSKSGFDSIEECFGKMSKYIYAVETGLSCYNPTTEVLTENGWKPISDIITSDKICTLNVENDRIEFQFPTRLFKYDYEGKMYRLRTKRVDLLVTPNHKLLYSHCDFRKPPTFILKEAEQLIGKSKRFKKNGIWIGEEREYFILPRVKIKHGSRHYSGSRLKKEKKLSIEPWLKFFGFWIAEGWTTGGKNGDYSVCVCNNDLNILKEITSILENFGYNVFEGKNNVLRVRDFQLYHYLKKFGQSGDKFVPSEVKSLSKELLSIFFEYYIKGDGHVYGRGGKGLSATTTSVNLRDDLQEIALKLGLSAYYKLHNKKGTIFSSPGGYRKKYKQTADSWVIYFLRKNIHTVLPSLIKKWGYTEAWVNYSGLVYCVEVPNHVIYVRRNGIPVWCGNSDPGMNWQIREMDKRQIVSFSDAHSPGKLGREATIFQIKNAKLKMQNDNSKFKITYNDVVGAIKGEGDWEIGYTVEFYPEEGKYHWTGHRICGVRQSPEETEKLGRTCPVCGKGLTIGVMHRVQQLSAAGRKLKIENSKLKIDENGVRWVYNNGRPGYVSLVPLLEILAEAMRAGVSSQKVINEYNKLTDELAGEFAVLLEADLEAVACLSGQRVAEGIKKVRLGEIAVVPGYDGVFGTVKIWEKTGEDLGSKKNAVKKEQKQMNLFQ